MALYTAVSTVSKNIQELLGRELVPSLIPSEEYIGFSPPNEREGLMLGIFLYDIRESDEIKANQMVIRDYETMRYPPVYLNLYYMITAYAQGDAKSKALREEMVLGKIIRYFHDNPVVMAQEKEIPAKMELMKITMEEKMKLWSLAGMPYKLSLFYKVSPVTIDSGRIKEISRVTGVEIRIADGTKELKEE